MEYVRRGEPISNPFIVSPLASSNKRESLRAAARRFGCKPRKREAHGASESLHRHPFSTGEFSGHRCRDPKEVCRLRHVEERARGGLRGLMLFHTSMGLGHPPFFSAYYLVVLYDAR